MSFVSIIPHDGSSPQALRITMPTAIAPRYGVAPTNIPWFKKNRGNRFELTVAVQMSKTVTSISSPSHPIGLTLGCAEKELTGDYEPSKVFVRLGNSAFLDKDIVIVISAQGLDAPRCTVERWLASEGAEETTDAYALTLVPKFDLPPLPSQEYIFLVDRSGSMDGGRMEAVKTSLQIMLKSLPSKNTTFNIISFGSDHTSLWHKSQIYSAETVAEASKHVDTFTANYGGTSLRSALRFAFSSRQALAANSTEKPPASVFVLTDGEAWDLDGVNNLVRESVESAKKQDELLRAFVLGVGNQVSTAMCEAIARAGQGCAVFVAEGEKPAAKLMNLLKAARGGMIEDLAIDWGVEESVAELEDDFEMISDPSDTETPAPQAELPPLSLFDEEMPTTDTTEVGPQKIIMQLPPPPVTQQAPKSDKLPVPLYPGFRCSIFAIIKQPSNPGPYSPTIKITGKVLGRAVAFQVPVTPITVNASTTARTMESGKLLHTLAAKALIQVYEDMQTSAETKAQIERLGKRYSLASSVTSFLAIDHELSSAQAVRSQANTISPVVESRRFRSRSPRTTMIPAPMESSRSRSRSPQIIHVNASVKSRRSRVLEAVAHGDS
ncbi:hypothetical protein M408DRAFT_30544 [Serendipita vermifera MAFF 305830]|uniref:VWFA domain-containing protein n=1 Tax=Serendipita vermifera MAFF 305830 TaxID=933852 RepID=A0A0C2WRM7_SERVB|nr:hypothetical protein M408DRAFT_30544 [Serendipita vermifera MAFF 305830]